VRRWNKGRSVTVCLRVRALKEKRLELLSNTKTWYAYALVGASQHALTQRSKGQRSRSQGYKVCCMSTRLCYVVQMTVRSMQTAATTDRASRSPTFPTLRNSVSASRDISDCTAKKVRYKRDVTHWCIGLTSTIGLSAFKTENQFYLLNIWRLYVYLRLRTTYM